MKKLIHNNCCLSYEVPNETDTDDIVLFFNGSLSSMAGWRPLTETLRNRGIRVLVHDMRGQLHSPWSGPISYTDHSDDARAIVDAEGLDRVHVVGISYGTATAQTFVADWPEQTTSLILISAFSEMDANTEAWVKRFIAWGSDAIANPAMKRAAYENMAPLFFSPEFAANNTALIEAAADAFEQRSDDFFEGMIQICRNQILNTPITERLKEIRCPTFVVHAEMDVLTPWFLSEKILKNISDSGAIRIPGAGHAVNAEKPGLIDSLISGFISRHSIVAEK